MHNLCISKYVISFIYGPAPLGITCKKISGDLSGQLHKPTCDRCMPQRSVAVVRVIKNMQVDFKLLSLVRVEQLDLGLNIRVWDTHTHTHTDMPTPTRMRSECVVIDIKLGHIALRISNARLYMQINIHIKLHLTLYICCSLHSKTPRISSALM